MFYEKLRYLGSIFYCSIAYFALLKPKVVFLDPIDLDWLFKKTYKYINFSSIRAQVVNFLKKSKKKYLFCFFEGIFLQNNSIVF